MQLYLMQHGACLPEALDPEQPLSPMGQEQVQKSGEAIRKMGVAFGRMICSPKLRAQQTARIVAREVNYPEDGIIVSDAVKAMSLPQASLELASQFAVEGSVFIAGHLPSVNEIISLLTSDGCKVAVNVENGGLARLDISDFQRPSGALMWYLSPWQMQLFAGL